MKTVAKINEESRNIVKAVYPDAYYDYMKSGVFTGGFEDKAIAYGKTANHAWYEAAEEVKVSA